MAVPTLTIRAAVARRRSDRSTVYTRRGRADQVARKRAARSSPGRCPDGLRRV